ncbi:adenosylhomocysteinase [archaeon]|nr:adenosylhomocysteinase [archaeon]
MSDIKDHSLKEKGDKRIQWANIRMPVLQKIKKQFEQDKPFEGTTIGACLHVTTETANLMYTLKAGGAEVALCASNPLSTQDDVTASLDAAGIEVFAIHGEDNDTYYKHVNQVLDKKPTITMDDGGDLISTIHKTRTELLDGILGGSEETTTGVIRFQNMEKEGVLKYPVIAVNDANTKHYFDNYYGTGQSTIDGILRATNILLPGKTFVVGGYGFCGRGVALRAKGMGANVIVTEVDPFKALQAVMDGYRVMPMLEAAKLGDVFVTVTGNDSILREEHFKVMKDKAILSNSGHFNTEIELSTLEKIAKSKKEVKENVKEYDLENGNKIYVLAQGRLVNLACAEGHPAEVMDMSFADQAFSARYIKENHANLEPKVYVVPKELDERVAKLKLETMGIQIDELTEKQKEYLSSWKVGT